MLESKNLSDVLDELLDRAIAEKFDEEGWFDSINEMSMTGMITMLITIAWSWMQERVKKDTPLSVRYDMAESFGKVVTDMLKEHINEKYAK